MTNFEKVKEFMQTFGQEVKIKASFSDEKTNQLRLDLISEELDELKNEFRDDLSITNVYGYTRGGLLELSRSRNDRSIDELNLN